MLRTVFWIISFPYRAVRWLLVTRPIRFTRFGLYYVIFTIAIGAAAINTGNNLLYIILGLLLGFIIISGFLSDSCLWGIDLECAPVGELYAGKPARFELAGTKRWFPGITVRIETQWENLPPAETLFFWMPIGKKSLATFTQTPNRRGIVRLTSTRISTRFPFGLFEKFHRASVEDSWVVYPPVFTLDLQKGIAGAINQSSREASIKGPGTVPFEVREFRQGDSVRQIHWKTTARRGVLFVKDTETESQQAQLLLVRAWPEAGSLEDFISFLASALVRIHETGQRPGLRTPGKYFQPDASRHHLRALLHYLALLDPESPDEHQLDSHSSQLPGLDALEAWRDWKQTGETRIA